MTKPATPPNANAPVQICMTTASQVAWQFVPHYYTHVNQKPDALHRFYTKHSYFSHGVEGDDVVISQGQQEIHNKIMEIDYQECKTFVHSLDAQASANNGILIHVIGEMSNKGEAWRKFVQTFFLAEQTNGYYVLNDNFRYLKEETFLDDGEEEQGDTQAVEDSPSGPGNKAYTQAPTNGYLPTETVIPAAPVSSPAAQPEPAIKPPEVQHEPVVEPVPIAAPPVTVPEINPKPPTVIPTVREPSPAPAPPAPISPAPPSPGYGGSTKATSTHGVAVPSAPSPTSVERKHTPSPQGPPKHAPSDVPSSAPSQGPPTTAPAAPPTPSAPKTWAHLAATNSARWGQTVAQEAKGVSATPPHAQHHQGPTGGSAGPAAAVAGGGQATGTGAGTNAPAGPGARSDAGPGTGRGHQQQHQHQQHQHQQQQHQHQHPSHTPSLSTSAHCFVKGVTENIPQNRLEEILTQRFGPIKECEVIRSRACAFLEFKSIESARKAIQASLPPAQGGEGGIRLDEKEFGSPARIQIETRKEKGDRPPSRPRGGAPAAGGGGSGPNFMQGDGGGGRGASGPGGTGSMRGRGGGRGRTDNAGRGK